MPSLSALLATTTPELALAIPDDWAQGRSVFGGLQAAFAVRAMRTLEPAAPLRSLQVTFVAPIAACKSSTKPIVRPCSFRQPMTPLPKPQRVDGEKLVSYIANFFI